VGATASSGLPVSFASATPAVCTVDGSSVTIKTGGSCTVTASQDGQRDLQRRDAGHQSFDIAKASQTITFGALGAKTLADGPFTVSATASSGLPVSFASATAAVCTVDGSTVTITGAGAAARLPPRRRQTGATRRNAVTRASHHQGEPDHHLRHAGRQDLRDGPFTVSATASSGLR
jgi:hypothetical protein